MLPMRSPLLQGSGGDVTRELPWLPPTCRAKSSPAITVIGSAFDLLPKQTAALGSSRPGQIRSCAHRGQYQVCLTKMSCGSIGIPSAEMDDGVAFLLRDPAGSAIEVTDEGTNPMKTHRQTLHVAKHARTVPAESLTGAQRTDPVVRATRGIIILAFALGSLGTDVAATSSFGTVDHVSAHPSAGNIRLAASVPSLSNRPWMY